MIKSFLSSVGLFSIRELNGGKELFCSRKLPPIKPLIHLAQSRRTPLAIYAGDLKLLDTQFYEEGLC